MSAPLFNALKTLAQLKTRRFHLPGHKGKGGFANAFEIDFTEIPATGNLYDEEGIIQCAEQLFAEYYGAGRAFFLTCGATQGVKAALAAFCGEGTPLVIDRNCHQSAIDACAALDLRPVFVYPRVTSAGLTGDISPGELSFALKSSGAKAALVTSPTYYGINLDIKSLAKAAHESGAKLIVDSAHGSHLRACGVEDALACGADAAIFSAHKTLTALGQGAVLLVRDCAADFARRVRAMTAFFGTTSPSYPIMASLDLTLDELKSCPEKWKRTVGLCLRTAECIQNRTPFSIISPAGFTDPCRLTVNTASGGISGFAAADFLRTQKIEPEMADAQNVVLIFTPRDGEKDASAVCDAFCGPGMGGGHPLPPPPPLELPRLRQVLSPRAAFFAPKVCLPLENSIGQIAAQNISPYPPGVPAVIFGEQIDEKAVEYLTQKGYNGKSNIFVARPAVFECT